MVGTDGAENASTTWTKAAITAAIAEQKNLLVVFMATNFADLDLIMKQSESTNPIVRSTNLIAF